MAIRRAQHEAAGAAARAADGPRRGAAQGAGGLRAVGAVA